MAKRTHRFQLREKERVFRESIKFLVCVRTVVVFTYVVSSFILFIESQSVTLRLPCCSLLSWKILSPPLRTTFLHRAP